MHGKTVYKSVVRPDQNTLHEISVIRAKTEHSFYREVVPDRASSEPIFSRTPHRREQGTPLL